MSITRDEHEADPPKPEVHASLLSQPTDHCPVCGTTFAPDQRYCLECGEPLGGPRLPSARQAPQPAPPPRRVRLSPNATLIAGVGTLLLALGIGVLIGHAGNSSAPKTSSVQVVSVPGAGTATSGVQTTAAAAGAAAATHAASSHHKSTAASTKAATKTAAAAPHKVVKVGVTKGTGPGYDKKTHKFTGNFFGQ